ncbi:MAG TPA: substrate-binding domain-containing protein [Pseudonocardia sp.]|jgi:ribose transport system substrate-binding protein|nr:substrate-binding domain-containing protein [Pseudonocardia sp.]
MMNTTRAARVALSALGIAALVVTAGCSTKSPESGSGGSAGSAPSVSTAAQVKVALVPGGAHPYFQPWKTAGEQAKTDLGLGGMTFDETGQWDQAKQNAAINSLAAQGYNAMGIFGVSPTDINSTFSDLKSKGITVASLGSCPAGDTDQASFCLSTEVQQAAEKAAQAAITAMGGQGVLVHLTGNNVDSNTQRRIAGVKQAIDATGGKVRLLTTITDIDTDLQTAQKAVSDLLSAQGGQINGIVSTAYNPAVAAAAAVKASKLPIKDVAIDDDPTILAGIRDGSVSATVAQNPAGQAYVGTWALSKLATGACTVANPGVAIDSGSFVVDKKNVDTYDSERQAKTKELLSQFQNTVLKCKA